MTDHIKKQIMKDKLILADPVNNIDEIVWIFSKSDITHKDGASKKILNELESSGIRIKFESEL